MTPMFQNPRFRGKVFLLFIVFCLALLFSGCSSSSGGSSSTDDSYSEEPPEDNSGPPSPTPNPDPTPIPPADDENSRQIGINLHVSQIDWSQDRMFVDLMKMARDWYIVDEDFPYSFTELAPVDEHGWPTTDAKIAMWHGIGKMHGTYYLEGYANSEPTITPGFIGGTISDFTYDQATHKFTALFEFTFEGADGLSLQFTNTNGGIRDFKMIRPIYPGASQYYDSDEVFTNEIKAMVEKFDLVRFLWPVDGWNGPWQIEWSDRVDPNYCSFQRNSGATINGALVSWAGTGMAWEYAIQFANETGKDVWIIMPTGASDDYIRNLAQLWKDTYTVPDGKIYWEYSNEATWDGLHLIQNYLLEMAQAEADAGGPVGYDNDSDFNVLKNRYYAERAMQMSLIWREVWGDAAMMTKIRPVHSGFTSNEIQLTAGLAFLHDYYNNAAGDYVADPHPVNYFFYGAGGHYYVGDDPDVDGSINLDRGSMDKNAGDGYSEIENEESYVEYEACLAKMYGLERVTYEGGVWTDHEDYQLPRVTDAMIRYHQLWDKYDGKMLTYFVSTGGEDNGTALGFTKNIYDLDTPKFEALDYLTSTPKTPTTGGKLAPCEIYAADYSVKGPWDGGEAAGLETEGYAYFYKPYHGTVGYIFRTDTDREYTITLNGRLVDVDLEIMVDGVVVTREIIPGEIASTPAYSFNVPPGLHGLKLSNYGSTPSHLDNLVIQ